MTDAKVAYPKTDDPAEIAGHSAPEITTRSSPDAVVEPDAGLVTGLELELSEMRDRWMRSEAEIANVRTRCKREVDEARQYATQKFAADVVEMAENLKRGIDRLPARLDHESEIVARLRDGFTGIEHSFARLLERNGIKRQDPTGSAFDPGLHQSMDQKVSAAHTPGTVLQAWTSAWTLNGRLLRPAMVVVSTAAPPRHNPSE